MMQSPAEELAESGKFEEFISSLTEAQARALLHDWRGFLARPNQIAPFGDWSIWMLLAGRGFGKTRTGAEWVKEITKDKPVRIALIAETAADARDVMIEGDSGILNCYADDDPNKPEYFPSKRKIEWPNGSIAISFNGTEPNQLRGPQFHFAWVDELAKYRYARETWDQLQFGLRLGDHPQVLVTTTPRPTELVKAIVS